MPTRIIPERGFNLDYLMWLFTRISALSLVLLALVGVLSAMLLGARTQIDLGALMRWTFFPNPNHVVNYVDDVEAGWMNAYWQTMQILIVFFGATHGVNGIRMVLEDYLGRGFGKILLRGFLMLLWMFILIIAIQVVLAN